MAQDFEVEFGVLNITAQPHADKAVYRNLLKKIAGQYTNFYDQDWAAITEPVRADSGYYIGRIMIWTELDPDSSAIDKEHLEEISLEEANIELPPEYGINGRTFIYVLREQGSSYIFRVKKRLEASSCSESVENYPGSPVFKNKQRGANSSHCLGST